MKFAHQFFKPRLEKLRQMHVYKAIPQSEAWKTWVSTPPGQKTSLSPNVPNSSKVELVPQCISGMNHWSHSQGHYGTKTQGTKRTWKEVRKALHFRKLNLQAPMAVFWVSSHSLFLRSFASSPPVNLSCCSKRWSNGHQFFSSPTSCNCVMHF